MSVILFSDPHIGTKRRSHTTLKSKGLLEQRIYKQAMGITSMTSPVVCLGDLFDTFSNSERDIIAGANVASECTKVLAGNHDSLSQEGSEGSLDIVDSLTEGVVVIKNSNLNSPYFIRTIIDDIVFVFVPHHATNQLFEEALLETSSFDKSSKKLRVVCLHCNYDNDMVTDSDTSLNLTSKMADKLLEVYDYIFIGHEHNPRTEKSGKVVIVGNPYPTSFSDISDKFFWELGSDGELKKHRVFDVSKQYVELDYIPSAEAKSWPQAEFIDVTGEIGPADRVNLAKYMKYLWRVNPQASMIRNKVNVRSALTQTSGEAVDLNNLATVIRDSIEDKKMKQLWDKYEGEVSES